MEILSATASAPRSGGAGHDEQAALKAAATKQEAMKAPNLILFPDSRSFQDSNYLRLNRLARHLGVALADVDVDLGADAEAAFEIDARLD